MNEYIDIMENLDWSVEEYEDSLEMGFYTDAGEDFSFSVDKNDDIIHQIERYADCFSIDENVAMWLEAKMHGDSSIPCARMLVESAEEIQNKLDTLVNELLRIYRGHKTISEILEEK